MLLQSTILFAILALADRLTRRRLPARALYALWLLTLLKLILPPSLALPGSPASWISNMSWPPTRRADANTSKGAWFIEATEAANAKDPATPAPSGKKPIHAQQPIGLALVWITGMTALTIALVRNARRVCQDVRLSTPASPALEQLAADCARELGLRHPVGLRIGAPGKVPLLTGFRQPVILLPACLAENGAREQIRPVLLHEMAHLRRGDLWVHWAQTLIQIAYWWHPLVWMANARLRQLREEATDETVVQAMSGDTLSYAEALLRVADLCQAIRPPAFASSQLFASRSGLRRRVERLGDPAWSGWRAPAGRGWLIAAILAVLLLPMAPARTAKAQAATASTAIAAVAATTNAAAPATQPAMTKAYEMGDGLFGFLHLFAGKYLVGMDGKSRMEISWGHNQFQDHPEVISIDVPKRTVVLKATARDHARFQEMLDEHFLPPAQVGMEARVMALTREDWERFSVDARIQRNRSKLETAADSDQAAREFIQQTSINGGGAWMSYPSTLVETGQAAHIIADGPGEWRYDLNLKPVVDKERKHITTTLTASMTALHQGGNNPNDKPPGAGGSVFLDTQTLEDGQARIVEIPLNEAARKADPTKRYVLIVWMTLLDPAGNRLNHLPTRK